MIYRLYGLYVRSRVISREKLLPAPKANCPVGANSFRFPQDKPFRRLGVNSLRRTLGEPPLASSLPGILATLFLGLTCLSLFSNRAGAVTAEQESAFRKSIGGKSVALEVFAVGSLPYAGYIVDSGDHGEWRLLRLENGNVATVKSGRMKKDNIPLSLITFVTGDAHALVSIGERKREDIFVDMRIYDMTENPGQELFFIEKVVNPRVEIVSPTSLLLWQKDDSYFNRVIPPYKYNYYLITYNPTTGNYTFSFSLRKVPTIPDDEGVALNNRAVQLFLQGDLIGAKEKLEEAGLLAQTFRNVISENFRYLNAEIQALEEVLRTPSAGSGGTVGNPSASGDEISNPIEYPIDRSKLYFLMGDYDTALMQLDTGTSRYTPDSLALLGIIYGRKKDYANMQKVTRILTEKKYPALLEYYEEVCQTLFNNRDMGVLKAYLKVLEKVDPLSPILNYLKAGVLVEGGRLAFAKEMLRSYLLKADDGNRDLSLVKEYLYELARLTGDAELADRMYREVVKGEKYNLRALAYLATFDGTPHSQIVKVPSGTGTRFEGEFEPLELFAPVTPETPPTEDKEQ